MGILSRKGNKETERRGIRGKQDRIAGTAGRIKRIVTLKGEQIEGNGGKRGKRREVGHGWEKGGSKRIA